MENSLLQMHIIKIQFIGVLIPWHELVRVPLTRQLWITFTTCILPNMNFNERAHISNTKNHFNERSQQKSRQFVYNVLSPNFNAICIYVSFYSSQKLWILNGAIFNIAYTSYHELHSKLIRLTFNSIPRRCNALKPYCIFHKLFIANPAKYWHYFIWQSSCSEANKSIIWTVKFVCYSIQIRTTGIQLKLFWFYIFSVCFVVLLTCFLHRCECK